VYIPLHWKTPRPVPPLRNPLPIHAVAHKTIPFTHALSRIPMINSHLISSAPSALSRSLMDNTYSALKERVSEALLAEWPGLLPTPGEYHHVPALNPQPFIGLWKFVAGRIHQMRAGKSYLADHPTWTSPDADTSCPRSGLKPATFEHAILTCPSRQGAPSRLLDGVSSVGQDAPLWSSLPLLKRLATFISVTSTGLPSWMFLPDKPPSSPPLPLSRLAVPSPAFRVFSLAEF